MKNLLPALILVGLLIGCATRGPIRERVVPLSFTVHVNTAALVNHPAGPFTVDFQLTNGNGRSDGNSACTLSHFDFGAGGKPLGVPTVRGGASGSLGSVVTLRTSTFLNEFTQTFAAGEKLKFQLDLTSTFEPGSTPDQFSFALLDKTGAELPSTSPFAALLKVDLNSVKPTVESFPTDSSRKPRGGGPVIAVDAPQIWPRR